MSDTAKNLITKTLLKAVWWILQPLVKLLIDKGITYPVLCDLLKSVYVKTAQDQVDSNSESPSLSRIFVKTGINRKEVKRILNEVLSQEEPSFKSSSLGALLVSRWLAEPEYIDESGGPRKLARISKTGETGFNNLVESISKDIHPRALLDDWLELGIVQIDAQDRVCLNQTSFIPQTGFDEKVYFFGKNVRDHIDTCVSNLLEKKQAMLERSVFYGSLSLESIHLLQKLANQRSIETLELLNKEALSLKSRDSNITDSDAPISQYRFRYGCYWFDTSVSSDRENKK